MKDARANAGKAQTAVGLESADAACRDPKAAQDGETTAVVGLATADSSAATAALTASTVAVGIPVRAAAASMSGRASPLEEVQWHLSQVRLELSQREDVQWIRSDWASMWVGQGPMAVTPSAVNVLVWLVFVHAAAWSDKRRKWFKACLPTPQKWQQLSWKQAKELVLKLLKQRQTVEAQIGAGAAGLAQAKADGFGKTSIWISMKYLACSTQSKNMQAYCESIALALRSPCQLGELATLRIFTCAAQQYSIHGRSTYLHLHGYAGLCLVARQPLAGDKFLAMGAGFNSALKKQIEDITATVSDFCRLTQVSLNWREVAFFCCTLAKRFPQGLTGFLRALKQIDACE